MITTRQESWEETHPTVVRPAHIMEQVTQTRLWLLRQYELRQQGSESERREYQHLALSPQQVQTFAPFNARTSAHKTLTRAQGYVLLALLLTTGVSAYFLRLEAATIACALLTLFYVVGFGASVSLAFTAFRHGESGTAIAPELIVALDEIGVDWPTYTVLCPLYKEAGVVPQIVGALRALEYPTKQLQVLFLVEEADRATRMAFERETLPQGWRVLTVPQGVPQTKPRALNWGLVQATGQFLVVYDAEDIPDPLQLKKAVLTYALSGERIACVQAKLNCYNAQVSVLTRWFTGEYSLWFDVLLPGLEKAGIALPLGGTSNHFRTSALRALGGWDAFNVTEDADMGLRLSQYGLSTAVVDSTTLEEAPSRLGTWLMQRSRWIKGYMQTYLVQMRHPLEMLRKRRYKAFFSLQLVVGAWTLVLFLNPLMWALTLVYLVAHPVALYQQLFPGPVLYAGAGCFIFGNFFYVYIHILGCARRGHDRLIKWMPLLPLYWVLMSVAAWIALWQLIVKPHYWQKTQHGVATDTEPVHTGVGLLEGYRRAQAASVSLPTEVVPAVRVKAPLETVTQRVAALRVTRHKLKIIQKKQPSRHVDPWLLVTMGITLLMSVAATIYFYQHHFILAYGDANAHAEIARSLFDSINPGFSQLGGVWLPLPHILMLPFIWIDPLWQTGLAGSLVGMVCYCTTTIYIFLTAKRLTRSGFASLLGSLVFILNANVLYLQTTPLTEPICWATYSIAGYYLLAWAQEDRTTYLFLAAFATCLATLARYDGWILVALFPIVIIFTGILRHHPLRKIEGNLGLFLMLGTLGIALWLIWENTIFGDPLYFQRGPYSSQAATVIGIQASLSRELQHTPLLAAKIFGIGTLETLGVAVAFLALLGTLLFVLRRWRSVDTLASLAHWAPFLFYIVALNRGQVNMFDDHVGFYPLGIIPLHESINLFNSRFGSEIVAPAAVFIATLVPTRLPAKVSKRSLVLLVRGTLLLCVLLQSGWIAYGGVISLISNINPPFCVNSYNITVYLQEHYNGGRILQEQSPFHLSESESNIHLNQVVYEGSGPLWEKTLQNPATFVEWVVFQPGDAVSHAVAKELPAFLQEFSLVVSNTYSGIRLYHRNGLPPLPTRPISSYLADEQQFCTLSNYKGANQ